jgi:cobalamin biosynthesis protein CobT
MNTSTLLPKLLAKENVTIQHGNYKTAWFDIKNRVLGLPLWEDMHKDVYDLFVGHEVGHALETPFEGWHDSPDKLKGCPRSYINVVEDARIERKIQSRYPGLVGSFNRGYERLLEREFFGPLTDIDWDQVKLIDKINLKTKLGSKLEVPFTSEEQVFLTRSLETQTFDEVLILVRDILAWTKENQDELMQKPEPQESQENNEQDEPEMSEPSGHDDYEESGEDMEDDSGQTENTESDEEVEETTEEDISVKAAQPVHSEEDQSVTDTIFREMEKTLTKGEDGEQPVYIGDVNKAAIEAAVINYSDLKEARKLQDEVYGEMYGSDNDTDISDAFQPYMKTLKKNVQVAVKEFEMRKAAYQYSRGTTAKTGKIDVNRLWSYKTNEDIFLNSTKLANAKNHGMMLLIDMSGHALGYIL